MGIVSKTDVIERKTRETSTAQDIMTEDVVAVQSFDDVSSVAAIMQDRQIHRVVVYDTDKLAGLVTTFDMLEVVRRLDKKG